MDLAGLQARLRLFAAELLQVADETAIVLRTGPAVRTHVFVDWENVQPSEVECRALVPEATDVWLFHGPNQKTVGSRYPGFGERVTEVRIARTGKNALDFHLSFYLGYIVSKQPDARVVVLSNDKGYGPMLDHAKQLGFTASQSGFGIVKAARVARKSPARKAAAQAAPAKKRAASGPPAKAVSKAAAKKGPAGKSAAGKAPAVPGAKALPRAKAVSGAKAPPTAKAAPAAKAAAAAEGPPGAKKSFEQVLAILKKVAPATRPRKHARLLAYVASRVGTASETQAREMLDRLVAEGKIVVDEKWNVSYRL